MIYSTSGEPVTIVECRNCKKAKATGINHVRSDGISVFKCDSCGKLMRCGLTELVSNQQKSSLETTEKTIKMKDRERRELANKQKEEAKSDSVERFGGLGKAGFLFAHFTD